MKCTCGSGFPTYSIFFKPTLNNNLLLEVKIPKKGTFSGFDAIFLVKSVNKLHVPTYTKYFLA